MSPESINQLVGEKLKTIGSEGKQFEIRTFPQGFVPDLIRKKYFVLIHSFIFEAAN